MMKNGIYLSLILFFGVMGYFVVNDLMQESSYMLASMIFLLVSVAIAMLTTHYKKRVKLQVAQKVINVIYISLFALYGIVAGISLVYAPTVELSSVKLEGGIFLVASFVLLYGVYMFMKSKVLRDV